MKQVLIGGLVAMALVSGCTSRFGSALRPTTPNTVQTASGTVAGDSGLLQSFTPVSTTTWWAVVDSNLTSQAYVARTTDSGQSWRDVLTPPGEGVAASDFLNAETAWVAVGGPSAANPALYGTTDGGRTWQEMGTDPGSCDLQFIDDIHGWCVDIGAAAGSEAVDLYRTADAGRTWALVSRTSPAAGEPSTPGALPFGCDKTINFTTAQIGFAPFFCNGGTPYLYKTYDAGAHWQALSAVEPPAGAPANEGQGFETPVVDGESLAMVFRLGRDTAIATSSDGGNTWRARLVPRPLEAWHADLIDPMHWRLTNGTELMATDDAGAHWRTWTPSVALRNSTYGEADTLDFVNPLEGWAVPSPDGDPFWWTVDGGTTWMPVHVLAGPYTLPR